MNSDQASELAVGLHQMAEDEMASEIDEAVVRARRFSAM